MSFDKIRNHRLDLLGIRADVALSINKPRRNWLLRNWADHHYSYFAQRIRFWLISLRGQTALLATMSDEV